MDLGDFLGRMEISANANETWESSDYIGHDGLKYCGKCNTPKQVTFLVPWSGQKKTVCCLCKCEKEKQDMEKAAFEAEQERKHMESRKADAVNSSLYRQMTFKKANTTGENQSQMIVALNYSNRWEEMKKNNASLIFTGGCGVGKTFMAACIANELLDRGEYVYMATVGDMLSQASNFDTSDYLMDKVVNCNLLILDDFGAQRETDFAIEKVFEIVDKRIRSGKPFIVTTNLTKEELHNPSGIKQARIYSRLLERAAIIEFNGSDMRMTSKKNYAQQFLDEFNLG